MYHFKFARNTKAPSICTKNENITSSLVFSQYPNQDTDLSRKRHYDTLLVKYEENITKIILNRPEKKNAISILMFSEIINALEEAAKDDSVLAVITGSGTFFSSGIDLNSLICTSADEMEMLTSADKIKCFVKHFIDFPKPLVAIINGPAIGIFVTLLGLFDLVYATEKANEMLIFNKKLTAQEACDLGLVNEVFSDSTFQQEIWTKLKAYATLPRDSLALSKQLIRSVEKEKLYDVCARETDRLIERWQSDECTNAIRAFFQKRAKL
ncbi:enoyl-CoA delta isomerase 2-like isoform X2 [Ascaphus truei]|uniref:enoyl-CoA delta isomerase 2-like isoform X2 n=1 Tax=Ascaphus truei TaxID=8439 RepID=UPI003F59C22A